MPFAIDEEKLNSPNNKVMDINQPPMKSIPHEKFPQMVYLHPKDKAKEHLTKIVNSEKELQTAEKQGWKIKPHIPVVPEPAIASGEYETV